MNVVLSCTRGPLAGRAFALAGHDTFLFGRDPECHAPLPPGDRTASRHHFLIEGNPPGIVLRDLASLNGTFVNGVRHGGRSAGRAPEEALGSAGAEVELSQGDRIDVGHSQFVVTVERGPDAAAAARPSPPRAGPGARPGPSRPGCREDAGTMPARDRGAGGHAGLREDFDAVPERVAGCRLIRPLGEGASGTVFLAHDERTGRPVAVKLVRSRAAAREDHRRRFHNEVAVALLLRHAHVVDVLAHGALDDGFYLVMEYCAGGDLRGLVRRRGGRVPLREAGPLMLGAIEALAFAHQRRVVHRDVKPGNVLLTAESGGDAKLGDFGFAKFRIETGLFGPTLTGDTAGTADFMAREQVVRFKHVEPPSDVWSAAAVLYYLLTGRPPREPTGGDPVRTVLEGPVMPLRDRDPSLPAALAAVLDRALSPDPADRQPDAGALAADLDAALDRAGCAR